MPTSFSYDIFISHSVPDRKIAEALASRLQADGLTVWLVDWQIRPGDDYIIKWESGLSSSRILLLCLSANNTDSEWRQLETSTFLFRNPHDKERRFIPLRLDDSPIPSSLLPFSFINWLPETMDTEYPRLLASCQPTPAADDQPGIEGKKGLKKILSFGHSGAINAVAFNPDGKSILTACADSTIRLWDAVTGECLQVYENAEVAYNSVAWHPDGQSFISASDKNEILRWTKHPAAILQVLKGHKDSISQIAWSPDGQYIASVSDDKTIRIWDAAGDMFWMMTRMTGKAVSVVWSPDSRYVLVGFTDKILEVWDLQEEKQLHAFRGHEGQITSVAWSSNGQFILSGSVDKTARIWDVQTGKCVHVMKGHTKRVTAVAWSPDGQTTLSGSMDKSLRIWNHIKYEGQQVFTHAPVTGVAWSPDGKRVIAGHDDGSVTAWEPVLNRFSVLIRGRGSNPAFSKISNDGLLLATSEKDKHLRLWDSMKGEYLRTFDMSVLIGNIKWSKNDQFVMGAASDHTWHLWEAETGKLLQSFTGHKDYIFDIDISHDGRFGLSVSEDGSGLFWDITTGKSLGGTVYPQALFCARFSPDGQYAVLGGKENLLHCWNITGDTYVHTGSLKGHTSGICRVDWHADSRLFLTGANDHTVQLWDIEERRCIQILEGHSAAVLEVAWSPDGLYAISGSIDGCLRLWHIESGVCLREWKDHAAPISMIGWGPKGLSVFSTATNEVMRVWDVSDLVAGHRPQVALAKTQVRYTNAKVLLVGDSGVGKTGLTNRLAGNEFSESISTDGAWATHCSLPHASGTDGIDREIWLWDFAGQVDYRLVHQLFMDDAAAAVLIFNPQHENPFEGLGQWDRDLQKAARKPFIRLLAAGRTDRGGLIVSDASITRFMQERGFLPPLHLTSARTGEGCELLRDAIVNSIDWQTIPTTNSPALYKRLKEEILHLRDSNLILIRLAELKQRMNLALAGENFELQELNTVLTLLSGPGIVQRLGFGDFILLKPEVLSRYAAATIRKVRSHPDEMGFILENDLLSGNLDYRDFVRLPAEDEEIILRALHETLIQRAWCIRQPSDTNTLLIFPSYFRRERPEQSNHPNTLVTYRFTGPADDIYATLVVRLNHTTAFSTDQLWKFAADFKNQTGKSMGLKLIREPEGTHRLEVYFQPGVDENSQLIFLRYIHNHLTEFAQNVIRLRHYTCENKKCEEYGQPFTDQARVDKALASGKNMIFCPSCGKPIQLRDLIEEKFESPKIIAKANKLAEESRQVIDNESRELILVGHAKAITGEAGQIFRETSNSDHGIDAEIEFKDGQGHATGERLYLQLKSGDSYLKTRKRDGAEVFHVSKQRWIDYWQKQAYPVMLVIRTSNEEIRWMDVTEYLKQATEGGTKTISQIDFKGERFDATSVRKWRDKIISSPQ